MAEEKSAVVEARSAELLDLHTLQPAEITQPPSHAPLCISRPYPDMPGEEEEGRDLVEEMMEDEEEADALELISG